MAARSRRSLVVLGAGGHAGEVLEVAVRCTGLMITHAVIGLVAPEGEKSVLGYPIIGDDSIMERLDYDVLIGVNASQVRARIDATLQRLGRSSTVAIHDQSTVGPLVEIQPGTVVHSGGRVGYGSTLLRHVYVGPNAVVGHDCVVGAYASILGGAIISGSVTIGTCVQVGAGAVVLQGLEVGDDATIGAGAVVTKDVAPGAVVVGIPARPI